MKHRETGRIIAAAGEWMAEFRGAVFIVGDFNIATEDSTFLQMACDSGLLIDVHQVQAAKTGAGDESI